MELAISIIGTLTGILLGGTITWFWARYYYQKAGQDLVEEAGELRKMNTLILRAIEAAELVELSRDSEGNIKGLLFHAQGEVSLPVPEVQGRGKQ